MEPSARFNVLFGLRGSGPVNSDVVGLIVTPKKLPWNSRISVEWERGIFKFLSPKRLIELRSLRNNGQDQGDIQYLMGLLDEN